MKRNYLIFPVIIIIILILFLYFDYLDNEDIVVFSEENNLLEVENDFIKVMTYNIHHGVGIDGDLEIERIGDIIESSGAKIVGLN